MAGDETKPKPAEETKPKPAEGEDQKPAIPENYVSKLGTAAKGAIGLAGTAGSFAVANFGLSKLGSGPTDRSVELWDWPAGEGWAIAGIVLFTAGAVSVIASGIWVLRASRVSLAYLQRTRLGKKIREDIEQGMPYLLAGNETLAGFVKEYATVAAGQDSERAQQLKAARLNIRTTAAAERTQRISFRAVFLLLAGALAVAVGGSVFSLSVNGAESLRADQLRDLNDRREDELRELATGELLPKTPTQVILSIPISTPAEDPWRTALGDQCVSVAPRGSAAQDNRRLSPVAATVIDVGAPPSNAAGPVSGEANAVFRIVTQRTLECPKVVDGWVTPDWIVLPKADAPVSGASSGDESGSGAPAGEGADPVEAPPSDK